jgi:hypothetical protein
VDAWRKTSADASSSLAYISGYHPSRESISLVYGPPHAGGRTASPDDLPFLREVHARGNDGRRQQVKFRPDLEVRS